MIVRGIRFGLLLQLAIGPICLFVLNISLAEGFAAASTFIFAVIIVDALFIAASLLGVSTILQRPQLKQYLRWIGGTVLLIFGIDLILSSFSLSILPQIQFFETEQTTGYFAQGFILTASNPLSIIFWGSAFSSQLIEHQLNRAQVIQFAFGCLCATGLFLFLVALVATLFLTFIPVFFIQTLNVCIGCILIILAVRLLTANK